jgi:hypothetical protein
MMCLIVRINGMTQMRQGRSSVLDELGLTGDQEALYVALVDVSPATLDELVGRFPDVPVGQALTDLERAGLVSRLAGSAGADAAYAAVPVTAASGQSEEEMLAAGVAYRAVYHPAGFTEAGRAAALRTMIAAGEQARVTESVPVKLFIADDQLGLIPLEVGGSAEAALVIRASSMLDTLIALFELVWERAIPVHAGGELPSSGTGPREDEAALLGRLGVGTRFQAGLQAVRRGWL